MYFFFFKQKTAYEMRISDWSSDVCSSDLPSGVQIKGRRGSSPDLRPRQKPPLQAGSRRGLGNIGTIRRTNPRLHRYPQQCALEHPKARSPRSALQQCREIGRASCRERGCPYEWRSGGDVSFQKKTITKKYDNE